MMKDICRNCGADEGCYCNDEAIVDEIIKGEEMEKEFDLSNKALGGEYSLRTYKEKDVKEFMVVVENDIENAQEDYANLDWISKEQAIKILKKRAGDNLIKQGTSK